MAVTQGELVQYKTNNGSVPAITLKQYASADGEGSQVAIGSASSADLLVLGTGTPTRLYSVNKDSGTSESAVTTANKFWVPA